MLLIENIYNTVQHKICNIIPLQAFVTILVYKIQLQYKRKKGNKSTFKCFAKSLLGYRRLTKNNAKKNKKIKKNKCKIALFKYIYHCSYVHLSCNAFIDHYFLCLIIPYN